MTDRSRRLADRASLFWGALLVVFFVSTSAQASGGEVCQVVDGGGGHNAFAVALAENPLYAFLLTWVSGLGVALTPCVYPMIVVTVSIFGAKAATSRWQAAGLSAVFVLGIVTLFVPLGVGAAKTGALMGAWLQNPWVFGGVALLFGAMALSFFGAFELALPSSLQNKLSEVGGVGFRGAFALGLVSALVATPCTGPFLTSLLVWIAESQNTLLGAVMMGAFALGLGTPFFLVGTFAMQLPKSGKWMVHVKTGLGVVLLVGALYYLGSAFPVLKDLAAPGVLAVVSSVAAAVLGVGALVVAARRADKVGLAAKVIGIGLTSVGTFLAVTSAMKPPSAAGGATVTWEPLDLEAARAKALAEGRPLLVDFTAEWCIACGELDKYTFSTPEVAQETSRFVAVKVDLSQDDNPVAQRSREQHAVHGLPTVLLFDRRGKEIVRCTDFVEAEAFVDAVRKVN